MKKTAIENMTAMEVSVVNVRIASVDMGKDKQTFDNGTTNDKKGCLCGILFCS